MANNFNEKEKNQDINTFGPSFINGQVRLAASYWKNNLSLSIEDVKPGENGMMKAVENTALKVSVAASTVALLESIVEDAIDAIKRGEDFEPEAVECGVQTNNLLEISNGSNINQPKGVYFVIYKDLDSNGKPKAVRFYQFNIKQTIRGYNSATGGGKAVKKALQEVRDFRKLLEEFTKASTRAVAHSVRTESNFDRLKIFRTLSAMAAAQGINLMEDVPKSNRYSNNKPQFSTSNEMEFEFSNDIEFSGIEPFSIN